jgi:hypothetical protein
VNVHRETHGADSSVNVPALQADGSGALMPFPSNLPAGPKNRFPTLPLLHFFNCFTSALSTYSQSASHHKVLICDFCLTETLQVHAQLHALPGKKAEL